MKLLVVSDNHGRLANLRKIIRKTGKVDALFHLGDLCMTKRDIEALVDCPTYFVAGNNDYSAELENEHTIRFMGKRILMVHGHYHGVYYGLERLATRAMYRDIDIVMYGHTHQPSIDVIGSVTLINPGSVERPRQDPPHPSYITIDVDDAGAFHFKINYLLS
ncbi:MAG: metallophosphoesterase [Eubacteriales bacterium]|nr:metallophosphoesterase [Eubacteriales bacterium]